MLLPWGNAATDRRAAQCEPNADRLMELLVDIAIVVVKAVLVLGALLQLTALVIWVERKGSAMIQDRLGANRAAILGFDLAGILNTLIADPVKSVFKEDFVPKGTSQFLHSLGPFMAVFPVLVSFAIVPFGPPLFVGDRQINLQLANLNVGILYVFAMGSLAVYGAVLGGWVSNNKFSLLGGLRATAQMISYEITMGISILGVLATISDSLSARSNGARFVSAIIETKNKMKAMKLNGKYRKIPHAGNPNTVPLCWATILFKSSV